MRWRRVLAGAAVAATLGAAIAGCTADSGEQASTVPIGGTQPQETTPPEQGVTLEDARRALVGDGYEVRDATGDALESVRVGGQPTTAEAGLIVSGGNLPGATEVTVHMYATPADLRRVQAQFEAAGSPQFLVQGPLLYYSGSGQAAEQVARSANN